METDERSGRDRLGEWLDAARCCDDASLHTASEFEKRQDRAARAFRLLDDAYAPVKSAPDDPLDLDTPCFAAADTPASAGARFGRFLVLGELGRGGHGIVYRAFDPHLNRQVALKVPRLEVVANPELQQRFLREAHAAAGLDHPNLVTVHEVGTVGPACYIVAQLCSGPTLAAWLREQTEPAYVRLAAGIVARLAQTVAYIHSRGVLHRDIKPSNILLEPAEAEGPDPDGSLPFTPKLTDFGLAQLQDDSAGLTRTGTVAGTPAYMAPEQAEGKTASIGPATDVYALGVVLYELLIGRPPFTAATHVEILRQIAEGSIARPSALRPNLPRDLEMICLKCLEYEPERRYPSAQALADDLERFLRGEPVSARPVGLLLRFEKWRRRRPLVAGLAAALVLCNVAALVTITWQWRRAIARGQEAERAFQQAHQAVRTFHSTLFGAADFDNPQYQPMRRELMANAMAYYESFLQQRPGDLALMADVAEAGYQLGIAHTVMAEHSEAIPVFRRAIPLWETVLANDPDNRDYLDDFEKTLKQLSQSYLKCGRAEEARPFIDRALPLRRRLIALDPENREHLARLAESLQVWSKTLEALGEVGAALAAIDEALAVEESLLASDASPKNQVSLVYLLSAKTEILLRDGKDSEAGALCERAINLVEPLVRQRRERPRSAHVLVSLLSNAAQIAERQGRDAEVVRLRHRHEEVCRQLVADYPTVPVYQVRLASAYCHQGQWYKEHGDYSAAITFYEKAREVYEAILERQPESANAARRLARIYGLLGDWYAAAGRSNEARAAWAKANGLTAQPAADQHSLR